MNAAGLIILALGVIMIIIGVKGSQHSIVASIKGVPAANKAGTAGVARAPSDFQTGGILPTPTGQPQAGNLGEAEQ